MNDDILASCRPLVGWRARLLTDHNLLNEAVALWYSTATSALCDPAGMTFPEGFQELTTSLILACDLGPTSIDPTPLQKFAFMAMEPTDPDAMVDAFIESAHVTMRMVFAWHQMAGVELIAAPRCKPGDEVRSVIDAIRSGKSNSEIAATTLKSAESIRRIRCNLGKGLYDLKT